MSRLRKTPAALPLLLLDIGNTRIKWAVQTRPYRRGCRFSAAGVLPLGRLEGQAVAVRRLLRALGPSGRVLVSNVAGMRIERGLRALVRASGVDGVSFLRTSRRAGGVRNAYPEPWRLGVDRWASLIGSRAEYPGQPLCLVTVGTAMTIDLLDAGGRHRGGCIIPAPRLMIESLLGRTAGIRRRAGGRGAVLGTGNALPRGATLFARSTQQAVAGGTLHAAAALVREALRAARKLLGQPTVLIIAGGGADGLIRVLRVPHRRRDDLVLRGLSVVSSAPSQFA